MTRAAYVNVLGTDLVALSILCILRRMMRHLELGPGCDSITMYRLLNLEALMIRPVNVVNAHAPKGTIMKIPVLTSATLANF